MFNLRRLGSLILLGTLAATSGGLMAQRPETGGASALTARDYVRKLRTQVSQAQSSYGAALLPDAVPGAGTVAHIENLRSGLKQSLLEAAGQITGSESVLAANRATAASLLDLIHSYEEVLGQPPGMRTTAWNVLSSDDLAALKAQAIDNHLVVLKSFDALPAAERPPFLLARNREIDSWIGSLEREQALRAAHGPRGPPEIGDLFTLRQVHSKFPSIVSAESKFRGSFEQHLAFQVELRLTHDPGNAPLLTLREHISKTQVPIFKASPKRPPPTIENALADLDAALREESHATAARDFVGRARARARIQTDIEWLEAAGVRREASSPWGTDLVSTQSLKDLRNAYLDWRFRITTESLNGNIHLAGETHHASERIEDFDAEINRRIFGWSDGNLPPPEDPGLWALSGPKAPRTPTGAVGTGLRSYEISMNRNQMSSELGFLQAEIDSLGPIQDSVLKREFEATAAALKAEDTRLSEVAHAAVAEAESELLERGRGSQAAAEGERLLQIRRTLEAGGKPSDAIAVTTQSPYRAPRGSATEQFRILTEDSIRTAATTRPAIMEIPVHFNASTAPIADFEKLFPKGSLAKNQWTRSFEGVMEDLHRAPGGVVVDVRLPGNWKDRISEVKVDKTSGSLTIHLGDQWLPVEPRNDAETLRLAYAFVKDGRVMPIDLRNLDVGESVWLAEQITTKVVPSRSDWETIADGLASLTAVNVHPSLKDTSLAMSMIYIDQFIFDLLPDQLDPTPLYGASTRFGLNIGPLRTFYIEDFHNLSNPSAWRALFQKSILSVSETTTEIKGDRFRVDCGLKFAIYRLPAAKSDGPAIRLDKSTLWLQQNEPQLKRVTVLDPLIRFAAATAVIRTTLEKSIPNNFETLLTVPVAPVPTPRLLCRPQGRRPCGIEQLR